jgi:hypothetical protein
METETGTAGLLRQGRENLRQVFAGRVDLGGRPPRPPTGPDLWNELLI